MIATNRRYCMEKSWAIFLHEIMYVRIQVATERVAMSSDLGNNLRERRRATQPWINSCFKDPILFDNDMSGAHGGVSRFETMPHL